MSRMERDNLLLTSSEAKELVSALLNPKKEVFAKRAVFFRRVDELSVREHEDGTIFLEVPNFELKRKKGFVKMFEGNNRTKYVAVDLDSVKINVNYQSDAIRKDVSDDEEYRPGNKNSSGYRDAITHFAA